MKFLRIFFIALLFGFTSVKLLLWMPLEILLMLLVFSLAAAGFAIGFAAGRNV